MSSKSFVMKDAILAYLQLAVYLMDGAYTELLKGGRLVMELLRASSFTTYASLSALALIAIAGGGTQLKIGEGLVIDCDEPESSGSALFLARKILLSSLETERSLAAFEDYLYILSQLAIKPEGTRFIKAKTALIFEEQSGGRRDAIGD